LQRRSSATNAVIVTHAQITQKPTITVAGDRGYLRCGLLAYFDGRIGLDEFTIADGVSYTHPHCVDTRWRTGCKRNQLRVLLRRSRVNGYWFEQRRIVDYMPAP
jgi:hypothetical protein